MLTRDLIDLHHNSYLCLFAGHFACLVNRGIVPFLLPHVVSFLSFSIAGISDELNVVQMAAARATMQSPSQSLAVQSTVSSIQHTLVRSTSNINSNNCARRY